MRNDDYAGMSRKPLWLPSDLAAKWKERCDNMKPRRISMQDDAAGLILLGIHLPDRLHWILSEVAIGNLPPSLIQPFLDALEAALDKHPVSVAESAQSPCPSGEGRRKKRRP